MNQDGKAGVQRGRNRARAAHETVTGASLSDHTQKRIGQHLRTMYDSVVQQPVPDRFRDLIAQLEGGETGPKG